MNPITEKFFVRVLLTAALLPATTFAQQQLAHAPARPETQDPEVVRFVVDGDGVHTGGSHYRAAFGPGEVVFTPALGQQAPHTFPWRYSLESVRRGGEVLFDVTGATPAQPHSDGTRVRYDRGYGISEVYDVRGEGLKQSFVFSELTGSGDLVVRGHVSSELAAPRTNDAAAIDFTSGRFGGVHIDSVLCYDAAGQQVEGSMRWDGSHFDLVLPGEFADRAQLPLVLDPMIGAQVVLGSPSNDDGEPDAAWLETAGAYLVVFERAFAADDVEIRGSLRDENNTALGGIFSITNGNGIVNLEPSVGAVLSAGHFVVAWQRAASPIGPWDISACSIDGTGAIVDSQLVTQTGGVSTGQSERHPDVADKPGPGAGTFVVYDRVNAGILRNRITIGASGLMTIAPSSVVVADVNAVRPRLSGGSGDEHALVWQSKYTTGGNKDSVWFSRVDNQGVMNATPTAWQASTVGYRLPDVDGNATVGYKAVAEYDTATVVSAAIEFDLTFPGGLATLVATPLTIGGNWQQNPRIAWVGQKFLMAWTEPTSFLQSQIVTQDITKDAGVVIAGAQAVLTGPNGANFGAAIASQRHGSLASAGREEALLLWNTADSATFKSRVATRVYRTMQGGGVQTAGSGCGSGVTLGDNGPFALGNNGFQLSISTTDPAPFFGAFLYGYGSILPCGSCLVVDAVSIVIAIFPSPTATLTTPLPIANNPALIGAQLDIQGLVWGTNTNACPILPDISLSAPRRYTADY